MRRFLKHFPFNKLFVSLFVVLYTFIPSAQAMHVVAEDISSEIDTSEDILDEGISDPAEIANPDVSGEEVIPVVEEVVQEVAEASFTYVDGVYTVNKVVVNEEYVYPDDSNVKVKFTNITEEGNLVIKRVELTQEEKELLNTSDDYGWDISSSMINGSFKYDLTLPNNTESNDVEVKYTEDRENYNSIDNNLIVNENIIEIKGLEHFTVFVVVDDDDDEDPNNNDEPNFTALGSGWNYHPQGYSGDCEWVSHNYEGSKAVWSFTGEDGIYAILPSWVIWNTQATNAHYTSATISDGLNIIVNQKQPANTSVTSTSNGTWSGWYPNTGRYNLVSGDTVELSVESGTDGNLVADAMAFINLNEIYVDQDWLGSDSGEEVGENKVFGINAFDTIQEGIDAVSDGGTVYVAAGTYEEQVVINKNLTLQGVSPVDTIIEAPSTPDKFKFPENSNTWEPVVFAFGGTADGAGNITGTGTIEVNISDIMVDGNDRVPTDRSSGILLRNANGTISNNTVQNMLIDGKETFGIVAYGDSNITITENTVSGYSRGGIGASGDSNGITATTNPAPYAVITNNTITGPGMGVPVTWAPNGIQIGWGATGEIHGNMVSGNGWPGTDWTGSGILVFASNDVEVDSNTVEDNETGIAVAGYMWDPDGLTASGTSIYNNTVDENTYGISIQDKSVNTTIENNIITNSTYDGIDICNFEGYPPTGTVIRYNTITNNNTKDDETSGGIWIAENVDGNEVSINLNNILDNKQFGILNTSTTNVVDAIENWWGDASGPKDTISGDNSILDTNPSGMGSTVIGAVKYDPWYKDEGMTTLSSPKAITNDATDIGVYDATLQGTNGNYAATGHSFWVSLTPFDTSSPNIPEDVYSTPDMGSIAANEDFSVLLSSLTTDAVITGGAHLSMPPIKPNTTYYYVAWARVGGVWYPGEIKTFTTLPIPAPTLVSPDNDAIVKGNPTQSWNSVSSADHYYYESYSDSGGNNPIYYSNVPGTSRTVGGNQTITFWWRVKTVDAAGNESDWSEMRKLTVDNTPPIVKITSPDGEKLYNTDVPLSGTVTDDNPHHYWLEITRNGVNLNIPGITGEQSAIEFTTTLTEEGEYYVTFAARDAAGGTSRSGNRSGDVNISFTIDKTQPTITDLSVDNDYVKAGDVLTITAKVTDSSGIEAVSADFSYNSEYTNRPTPTSDVMSKTGEDIYSINYVVPSSWNEGTMHIKVAARDNTGGNWVRSSSDVQVTVDNTPPSTSLTSDPSKTFVNSPVLIRGISTDTLSNVVKVTFDYRKTGQGDDAWTLIPSSQLSSSQLTSGQNPLINPSPSLSWTWDVTWTPAENGTYDIKVYATDEAGNIETSAYVEAVTYDTTPPKITLLDLDLGILKNITAEDLLSGVYTIQISLDNITWIDYTPDMNLNDLVGNQSGTYTIYIRVTDNAGNTTTDSVIFTIPSPAPTVTDTGDGVLGAKDESPLNPPPVQASNGTGGYLPLSQTDLLDTEEQQTPEEETLVQDDTSVKGEEDNNKEPIKEDVTQEENTTKWWIYPLVILPLLAIFLILWKRRKEDNQPQL